MLRRGGAEPAGDRDRQTVMRSDWPDDVGERELFGDNLDVIWLTLEQVARITSEQGM